MAVSLTSEIAVPLAKLLSIMAEGECIARDCAMKQASAADPRSRRFFNAQARHERFHALLFSQAAKRLVPRTRDQAFHSPGLRQYALCLDDAMGAGRWNEVVIGQQLVLENLGELVLSKLDQEMTVRGAGFERTRAIVLRQERAHHHFGTQWIESRLRDGRIKAVDVRDIAGRYIDLADCVLKDASGLLEAVDADVEAYRYEVRERMPAWSRGDAQ